MAKVLIVAEHLGGKLNAATAKCVSAAQALNPDSIDIVVLAADPAAIAAQAAQIDGVARVLAVANAANAHAIAQMQAPQVAKLAEGYSHVFGPSTTFGKDLMPAVVTSDLRLNEPRFIKLPDIMKAKSKPLETIALADLGVEANDSLKATAYAAPAKRSRGVMVKDAAELVAALKQKGLL